MRVLMVSDVFLPRVNGVSTSIQTFRSDLAAHNCESWLVAPEYPQHWHDDERILRQPSRYLVFDPEDRMMKHGATLAACTALAGRIDVLHVQTPFVAHSVGLAAARRLSVPIVATYHTFFEEYLHHYLPLLPAAAARAIARRFSRRQCNAVDAVVAPSRQLADVLRRYGVTQPIHTIPTGLDLELFAGGDGSAFRARHGIASGRRVMLLVGRVAHEKNIGFLLRVLGEVRRSVPEVLFVIAGEGPAEPSLHRAAADAGLMDNVLFVGNLDRRGPLLDCYRAADVFVFASRTETQGLVLLESLALGVPVVSTAMLGTKEVLDGAAGAIVVREDVAEFAAAVVRLLGEPALRAELAAAGHGFVERRWSSREMAKRLLALYDEVVRAERADSPASLSEGAA